ncbi:MAG: bifunctional ADP-dependent NAD(P)H-hydrate dehydratase/NAD(P)H-hydrate epimerase [Treponema sp.]|jgi:NAD(P)H-hydrate epimerase|nr:bifunctional ADP-dependent NAD(P)H-hydrate dehydratase/NAD(P)H-hydrate epimerase [Treponema sp.]
MTRTLFTADQARALDALACAGGFHPHALVEAAGRCAAEALVRALPGLFAGAPPRIAAFAGAGNNAADGIVLLRTLILRGLTTPDRVTVFTHKAPAAGSPRGDALASLVSMGAALRPPDGAALGSGDLALDCISGTGLKGPLEGAALGLAEALARSDAPVVSLDIPSGISDHWQPGQPAVKAGITLAIEPLKACLYTPASRPAAGRIVPVEGIFPPSFLSPAAGDAPILCDWNSARAFIAPVPPDAHKYLRGFCEIHAGSPGFSGAPVIAARGAQAAGAGLTRLVSDAEVFPILAARAPAGVMVSPEDRNPVGAPDALLLGPGWGQAADRADTLARAFALEAYGVPLILDADAIALARDALFQGSAILTPHLGEFARYLGLNKSDILAAPWPLLKKTAREKNAIIILKSHIMMIAAPDGRTAVVDGMTPALAAGGSGDLLAGLCAGLAARVRAPLRAKALGEAPASPPPRPDLFPCAAAAAALLVEAAARTGPRFTDPLETADAAAAAAGEAWLC